MTEQQNDIQQARDVLKKYRSYAGTAQDWALRGGTSRLIRIVSDPDLLDAIDLTLDEGSRWPAGTPIRQHAQRITAAIISAEERMNA